MDNNLMDELYPSRLITGPLSEDLLIKEIRSEGTTPAIHRDLLYRLLALRHNHFNMAYRISRLIQRYINSINNPRVAPLGLFFCYNYNKI